ncbi:MAG: HD domain-containing protein [SAR202 cluster bacterium]|nr:HD domain-containing protein [SAR202 cluster bacterium]
MSQPLPPRLAEVVAALSFATDLGMGQPMGHALRTCLLSMRIGRALNLKESELGGLYYVSLLRRIGCTSDSHDLAGWFPDDIAAHARLFLIDFAKPSQVLRDVVKHAGGGAGTVRRARMLVGALTGGKSGVEVFFRSSCEVAQRLAERLQFSDNVLRPLDQTFERWDGKGFPKNIKGEQLALSTRIAQVTEDAEVYHRLGGPEAAVAIVRQRSGHTHDPALADLFCKMGPELFRQIDVLSPWEAVMAEEPGTPKLLSEAEFDRALEAMADFTDLKSPYFTGHSRGVASFAALAAQCHGLPEADVRLLRRAGLVHDLGKSGIPNSVWEKPGSLSDGEWEQVRLHSYYTERVLARPPALAAISSVASMHHERIDGSGYHRGVTRQAQPITSRILAAADTYQTKIEHRPHRAALAPQDAAAELQSLANQGRIDSEALAAVLTAVGHKAARKEWPASLTSREVEVLRLIAQGYSQKQVAADLYLS